MILSEDLIQPPALENRLMKHTLFLLSFLLLFHQGFAQSPRDAAEAAVTQLTESLSVSPLEVEISSLVLENTGFQVPLPNPSWRRSRSS